MFKFKKQKFAHKYNLHLIHPIISCSSSPSSFSICETPLHWHSVWNMQNIRKYAEYQEIYRILGNIQNIRKYAEYQEKYAEYQGQSATLCWHELDLQEAAINTLTPSLPVSLSLWLSMESVFWQEVSVYSPNPTQHNVEFSLVVSPNLT